MSALIEYFRVVFDYLVLILNFQPFPDFPLTFIQLMCCTILIKYIFKFIYGGFKEFEFEKHNIDSYLSTSSMNNTARKEQLIVSNEKFDKVSNATLDSLHYLVSKK